MLSTIFSYSHGRNPLIRPGKTQQYAVASSSTANHYQFSSTARPACLGSKGTTKSNHVESIFFHHGHVVFKNVIFFNFEASFGVGFFDQPFSKKKTFFTLNSGLQSTCLTDRLLCEMDPIWTACQLRSSQSIGQFYAKSGKWKLVFVLTKNLAFKNLLAHLQQLRCATLWDGSTGRCRIRAKFCGPEALYCLSVHGLLRKFCAHCNRQIGTLKIDLTVLAFWWDDHESQGNWTWTPFTKLTWKWYFYSSKLTGVSSDRVYTRAF